MAFFLKHKAFGYKQYMQLKKSKGIFFGLASYWVLDIASRKKKDLTPVSHFNSTAFHFQGVYKIVATEITLKGECLKQLESRRHLHGGGYL